ncbi:MAG TPA: EAL domain-containing protein [Gammaproteobacteria bacterium]|jgi:diguanylate cyclase (GGDEF)-like protein/PAS domain S-box-containing protein|nr:EAL domain-containing protein [Gammaproteobacteria bacterium]
MRAIVQTSLYVVTAAALTGVYFIANYLGLYLKLHYYGVAPLWPAAGISVAFLWLAGLRWWPVILVGEVLSMHFLGLEWLRSASGALSQLTEALLAVFLLKRGAVDPLFSRSRDVLLFVLSGCLLPAMIGAGVGIAGLIYNQALSADAVLPSWGNWVLGDAMGILIVTPLIAQWRRWPFPTTRMFMEWLLLVALLLACTYGITLLPHAMESNLFFLLLPFAALAAARCGAAGATSIAAFLALFVLSFNVSDDQDHFLALVRIVFVGATAFTGHILAAAFSERRAVNAALNAEQERALVTLQAIGEGVISTHADGKVYFMNGVAEKLTGWRMQDAEKRAIEDVFPLSLVSGDTEEHTVRHCLMHGANSEILTRRLLRDRSGILRPVEGAITLVRAPDGRILGGVVVFRDVSEAEQLRERLVHEASHDSLTGLRNRAAFDRHLRELTGGKDRRMKHALLYLDLDQFKLINDTRGHETGDRLLIELTKRMRALIHKPDIIARLGGDEFGVLVLDAHEKTVLLLAEELRRAVLDYRFKERDLTFTVGVSIGVTFFTPGERASEVLSRADIACYIAKGSGRNAIHVYRVDDVSMMRHHSDLTRVTQLESAMNEGRFKLFGQRIVRLNDGEPNGHFYEVLLRLYEDGEIVTPSVFLPVAARYGLATPIDQWVLENSFKFLSDKAGFGIRLSINLDPRTLDGPDFHRQVMEHKARHNVPAESVCFEVTENVALENLTRAVDTMHKLSEVGFRFALDDFGSGVASFGYLQQLPVHYVKIDGRFVQNYTEDPVNPLVVRTLAELARMRGIQCIAECVENEPTRRELAKLGVDYGQGFFLHKPEPLPA